MSRADYYINLLKGKILSDEDIIEICKEFKLETPNFNNSHDWIFGLMSREILGKREEQKLKVYLNKFPTNNGLDYKKLGRQINLLGRTPEQQRNGMFETMNEADKKKDSQFSLTFTEIQDKAIKEGTKDGKMFHRMREYAEQMSKELCLLCDKPRDIDTRGFITIPDSDGKLYKVHYECVLKLIKEKLFS